MSARGRVDVFTRVKGGFDGVWAAYVLGVSAGAWRSMVAALEAGGEEVLVCRTAGRSGLGKHVYQTAVAQ